MGRRRRKTGRGRGWSPALKVSLALHAAAIGTLPFAPGRWLSLLGLLAADHAVLTAAGLWPRSRLLGPNLRRLPRPARDRGEVALTFDDGPDPEVTPRVLDLLDRASARATFFCIGRRVEAHGRLAGEIVARGHDVENHSHRHPHGFSFLGPRGQAREIDRAQRAIAEACGREPGLFRAPAGLRNPFLEPVLARRGLRLVSWTRRGFDAVDRDPERITRRLVKGLAAGDLLVLHDGCTVPRGAREPPVLEVLPRLLAALAEGGLRSVALGPEHLRRKGQS